MSKHQYFQLARVIRARSYFVSDCLQANDMLRMADQLETLGYKAEAARKASRPTISMAPPALLI